MIRTVEAGLAFLAGADAASGPAETLAGVLRALGQAESVYTSAHARVLSAFNACGACEADGQGTTRAWLHWQTRVTRGAAGAATGWMRRLAGHAHVAAALAAGELSRSWARQVCDWTDELPPDVRDDADQILVTAAAGGADLADLSGLARQMYERTAAPEPDDGPPPEDASFRDRYLRLDEHYRGAGRLEGDLTPECSAVVRALLDSLGKKAGPEDDRTPGQRHHDALEEAGRMLLASGTLPDVAGQPAHMLIHVTLDQILGLLGRAPGADAARPAGAAPSGGPAGAPGAGTVGDGGPGPAAARTAGDGSPRPGAADTTGDTTDEMPGTAHTAGPPDARPADAGAPGGGSNDAGSFAAGRAAGDGEAGWLASATAAQAYACDAKVATIVTGQLDPDVVAAAVRAYLEAADADRASRAGPPGAPMADGPPPGGGAATGPRGAAVARGDLLAVTLVRYAAAMLSGPSGLAAALRSGRPGPLGAGVSMPLDITSATATVPPHLRRAVIARDRHCAFPGCSRRPARCQAHHVIPRSEGGPTSLENLVLLCSFHHLNLIHRRGWTLALNPDGTTTARSPDGRKVLHSHAPPGSAAA